MTHFTINVSFCAIKLNEKQLALTYEPFLNGCILYIQQKKTMRSLTSLSEADRMSQDVLCINQKATGITCLNRNWNDSKQVHQWHCVFTQFYSQLNSLQLSILSKKAIFFFFHLVRSMVSNCPQIISYHFQTSQRSFTWLETRRIRPLLSIYRPGGMCNNHLSLKTPCKFLPSFLSFSLGEFRGRTNVLPCKILAWRGN